MIGEEILAYFEVTFAAFVVNIIPAFAPPTWIVLCMIKINRPDLDSLWLAFFGVVGSVAGRLVMYRYSAVLGHHLPQKQAENVAYFRKLVEGRKLGPFVGTFIYSLGPFPSNFLFIGSGISGVKLLPVIAGFGLGRFISYALCVYGSSLAYTYAAGFGIPNLRYIADIIGLLGAASIIFIDWRKRVPPDARA
jgi:membrane protein YqaA with SNARE-associated domain